MTTCTAAKIDSNVTGLRYAEEECPKILPTATPAVAAKGTLTLTANMVDGDTFTINGEAYTIKAVLSSGPAVANEILLAGTAAGTVSNIVAAINLGAGSGVDYSTPTVVNPTVSAAAGTGTSVVFTDKVAGAAGNTITTTTTSAEASFGSGTLTGGADVGADPVIWNPLEPNTYSNFAGKVTTVTREPINASRQRYKGNITDLAATGGFNMDLTATNLQDLLQGFMFADTRTKVTHSYTGAAGDLVIVADPSNAYPQLTSTVLDFTTLGLIPGEWIYIGGDGAGNQFANSENNGFKRVISVAAHVIEFDKSVALMSSDSGAGKTVMLFLGDVLRNEQSALIKRRTYQLERTLGSLDGLDPPQAEYMVGACPNQLTLNLAVAAKVTVDMDFVGMDFEQHAQTDGLKSGARPTITSGAFFNTSSDVKRVKLSYYDAKSEAPTPMFAFLQDAKLTINNSVTANKAVGTLGAIDTSAGDFMVSGTLTAYFSDIAAIKAVRSNANVSLDAIMVSGNRASIFDMPLLTLGDGTPNVVKDQPITLALSIDANSGVTINPNLDYTLAWTFFDNLPDLAQSVI